MELGLVYFLLLQAYYLSPCTILRCVSGNRSQPVAWSHRELAGLGDHSHNKLYLFALYTTADHGFVPVYRHIDINVYRHTHTDVCISISISIYLYLYLYLYIYIYIYIYIYAYIYIYICISISISYFSVKEYTSTGVCIETTKANMGSLGCQQSQWTRQTLPTLCLLSPSCNKSSCAWMTGWVTAVSTNLAYCSSYPRYLDILP